MATYHISSDGLARKCGAIHESRCPLRTAGSEHGDFTSEDAARTWAEDLLNQRAQGSFGVLAKRVAEEEIAARADEAREAAKAAAALEAEAVMANVVAAHRFFTPANLIALAEAKGLRGRRRRNELFAVQRGLGLSEDSSLAMMFNAYASKYPFSAETQDAREELREAIVAGRMVLRASSRAGYGSSDITRGRQALLSRIEAMEKLTDAVPNEAKPELNLGPTMPPGTESLDGYTASGFARRLAEADDREYYMKDWTENFTSRIVHYDKDHERSSNRMESLFGAEFRKIVLDGPSHGYTYDEAHYFENRQPARWAAYHEALQMEAKRRLGE